MFKFETFTLILETIYKHLQKTFNTKSSKNLESKAYVQETKDVALVLIQNRNDKVLNLERKSRFKVKSVNAMVTTGIEKQRNA